jgi:hypothetical protein
MPDANQQMLEKTFSDLALNTLRDKAPSLQDYMLGFQMIKSEEDGAKAVGIFGFEIDGDVYYAPVFFINGQIKGMESLYSVESDLFTPMSEDWINHIINKQAVEVGEVDKRSRGQAGIRMPNYYRLKNIPSGGDINLKLGSVREYDIEDLPTLLIKTGAAEGFLGDIFKYPRLREAFEEFYTIDQLKTAAAPEVDVIETPDKRPVTIINSVTDEGVDKLTDLQRETILNGGVAVIDDRPEVDKSVLYSTATHQSLENPTGGGLYDVVWHDGTVKPAIISNTSSPMGEIFVHLLDEKKYCIIDSTKVYVIRKYSEDEFAKALESKGSKPSTLRPNVVAVFVSVTGEGTQPFCINNRIEGADGLVSYSVRDAYYACAPYAVPAPMSWERGMRHYNDAEYGTFGRVNPNQRVENVYLSRLGSSSPQFTKNSVVVSNKFFYALELNRFEEKSEDNSSLYLEEKYSSPKADLVIKASEFGNPDTIINVLSKVASELEVWKSHDGRFNFRGGDQVLTLNKVASYKYLIHGHGLSVEDTELVLSDALGDKRTYFVKSAATLELPPELDEGYGNEMTSFHNTKIPYKSWNKEQIQDNRDFYQYISPFAGGEESGANPLEDVRKATQSGQKEVFDAAALASIIKSHAPTDMVEKFLPTIVSGMDRLGRLLFAIYWHFEEFEDRYGDQDISEFIDNLRSSYTQLGDVVMFAKKKTLAGDPDSWGLGLTAIESEGAEVEG